MISIDHAFKEGRWFYTEGTDIDVYNEEEGKDEAHGNMDQIIDHQSAHIKDPVGHNLRKKESETGKDHQGHGHEHDQDIRDFLQGIEFIFFGDGERVFFPFKNTVGIETALQVKSFQKFFFLYFVIFPIGSEEVADEIKKVVEGKLKACHVVPGDRGAKAEKELLIFRGICIYQPACGSCILHAQSGCNKDQEKDGIDPVPGAEP